MCHTLLTGVRRCIVEEKYVVLLHFCCIVEVGRKQSELQWGVRSAWSAFSSMTDETTKNLSTVPQTFREPCTVLQDRKALFRKRSGNRYKHLLDYSGLFLRTFRRTVLGKDMKYSTNRYGTYRIHPWIVLDTSPEI